MHRAASTTPTSFALAAPSWGEIARRVRAGIGPLTPVQRTWYDTFDWRLWRAGYVLELDRGGDGDGTLTLRARDNRAELVARTAEAPRLASDLPPGIWRRTLAGILGIRALVPVASEQLRVGTLRVTNGDGKTVALALAEEVVAAGDGDRGATSRVRVVPLRGYEAAAARLAGRLRGDAGAEPLARHPLEDAAAPSHPVGGYSSKVDVRLDPTMRADAATYAMLAPLLAVMDANAPFLAAPPDTEFLHDYRVALRRSRSVLKQARGLLPGSVLERWEPALRGLQQRTGPARDLDVFLLEFDDYRAAVPASYWDDLEHLRGLLRDRAEAAHGELAAYLASPEHAELTAAYRRVLDEQPQAADGDGVLPIAAVADARLRRAYRRLLRSGTAVTPSSPPGDVHRVRIRAKELRYLLELYATLYPRGPVDSFVRELKQLQDNLGEFQDSEVHAHALAGFADLLARRRGVPTGALLAIGVLADSFTRRQARARDEFASRFARFARPRARRLFDELLASANPRRAAR